MKFLSTQLIQVYEKKLTDKNCRFLFLFLNKYFESSVKFKKIKNADKTFIFSGYIKNSTNPLIGY